MQPHGDSARGVPEAVALRWTQKEMKILASEEREGLGLAPRDPLDPYALAREHGIEVYALSELRDSELSERAVEHFLGDTRGTFSAALIPLGTARIILDNDGHAVVRRRASIAHELGHHLLEHAFEATLASADHTRMMDKAKEDQANFVAGELLVPEGAAFAAAKSNWSNGQVARKYGVSEQFAQMRMARARVVAKRAAAKYGGFR